MKKSEVAANRFIFLLAKGIIRKNILPNSSLNYTGVQEEKDLEQFKKYVKSSAFDDLRKCRVKQYIGDEYE